LLPLSPGYTGDERLRIPANMSYFSRLNPLTLAFFFSMRTFFIQPEYRRIAYIGLAIGK
jgi:hypothetical protein